MFTVAWLLGTLLLGTCLGLVVCSTVVSRADRARLDHLADQVLTQNRVNNLTQEALGAMREAVLRAEGFRS